MNLSSSTNWIICSSLIQFLVKQIRVYSHALQIIILISYELVYKHIQFNQVYMYIPLYEYIYIYKNI